MSHSILKVHTGQGWRSTKRRQKNVIWRLKRVKRQQKDAMVLARASDTVVGGCFFTPRRCHLTGHYIGSTHAGSTNATNAALEIETEILIVLICVCCLCTTSTTKISLHYYYYILFNSFIYLVET